MALALTQSLTLPFIAQLFAAVGKWREKQGLQLTRWPVSPTDFVYHRYFSDMETSLFVH